MPSPTEQPVPLQQDTVTQLPGGGVRMVTAVVMLGGVPTPVQMQVIAMSDAQGAVLPDISLLTIQPYDAILRELREMRALLAQIAQVPFLPTDDTEYTRK